MSENKDLALFDSNPAEMPAFLMETPNMGNDNVSAEDMVMPQLKIMQPLSPEMETITGAQPGVLFNSVTNEMFENVYAVNLGFKKQFSVFKSRKKGGGFFGSFDTKEAATAHMGTLEGNVDDYQCVETGVHDLLLLDANGEPSTPARMYFKSTTLSVSRAWNTLLATTNNGKPRFSSVWIIGTEKKKNDQGTWWIPKLSFAGFVTEGLYEAAKAQYLANTASDSEPH